MSMFLLNYREYRTADKSDWPRGPWDDEPDKVQWIDDATGLDCLIVRNGGGALCGYVGVPDTHPWHGVDYNDCVPGTGDHNDEPWCNRCTRPEHVDVHGGLTFSDRCANTDDEARHICHVPAPGRPDHVWWFGFDCAHSHDRCPKYERDSLFSPGRHDVYRDIAYVRSEVARLAAQLAEVDA